MAVWESHTGEAYSNTGLTMALQQLSNDLNYGVEMHSFQWLCLKSVLIYYAHSLKDSEVLCMSHFLVQMVVDVVGIRYDVSLGRIS